MNAKRGPTNPGRTTSWAELDELHRARAQHEDLEAATKVTTMRADL